jgi:hypothetical protein
VRGERWRYHDFPVNQLFGIQSQLPNLMTQTQQVNDATDAENYLARLALFPRKFDEVIESLKVRESRKIIPPKFAVEKVAEQLKDFLATGTAGNVLVVSFKAKLEKIPADKMTPAARDALVKRAEEHVTAHVLPAYSKLAAYIESLRAKALTNDGAWSLPDGEQYYQHQVEAQTTTKMNAVELHQVGLQEVARIGAEMDAILSRKATSSRPARRARRRCRSAVAALSGQRCRPRPGAEGLPGHHRRDGGRPRSLVRRQAEGQGGGAGAGDRGKSSAFAYYNAARSMAPSRPCSLSTCARSMKWSSSTCARWPITRRFPAITCRSPLRRNSKACRSSAT